MSALKVNQQVKKNPGKGTWVKTPNTNIRVEIDYLHNPMFIASDM